MTKYLDLSLLEIHKLLKSKEIKPIDLVNEVYERIKENEDLNGFITLNKDAAIKRAIELEKMEVDNVLFGIPIVLKENIMTKDLKTTCASKMLDNFIPIYYATVVDKINDKKMIIIGKANMAELDIGTSSYYGSVLNPWDKFHASSKFNDGASVLVSSHIIPFALGSDTGGSIRQSSTMTGIVGLRPTYGLISRYGLVAYVSSLDQIGPMSRNVYENALLLNSLVGCDEKDMTSVKSEDQDFTRLIGDKISGMRVAVPNYFMSENVSIEIKNKIVLIIDMLKENGVTVDYVDIDYLDYSKALFEIISSSSASSNLARFDGIRYGYRTNDYSNLDELYKNTRAEGFGDEVKRHIMLGTYILSGDNKEKYYYKALKMRKAMHDSFVKILSEYDLIIGPTTCKTTNNQSYTENVNDKALTIPASLAGLPSMSLPIGFDNNGMPIGMQIIGPKFDEATIYKLASSIEKELNLELNTKEVL